MFPNPTVTFVRGRFPLFFQKGEFYTVSEMCVDGWFKGQSLKLGKSGVFPGNHVHQVEPGAKSVGLGLFSFFDQSSRHKFYILSKSQYLEIYKHIAKIDKPNTKTLPKWKKLMQIHF